MSERDARDLLDALEREVDDARRLVLDYADRRTKYGLRPPSTGVDRDVELDVALGRAETRLDGARRMLEAWWGEDE